MWEPKNYIETGNKVLQGKFYIENGIAMPARRIVREYDSHDDMQDDITDMNRQNFEVVKKLQLDIYNFIVVYVNKNTK